MARYNRIGRVEILIEELKNSEVAMLGQRSRYIEFCEAVDDYVADCIKDTLNDREYWHKLLHSMGLLIEEAMEGE